MTGKQKKQLLILLVILVAAVVALCGVIMYNKSLEQKEEEDIANKVLMEIEYSDIASVSFINNGQTITLLHEESRENASGDSSSDSSADASGDAETVWIYAEDESLTLDDDAVYSAVYNLEKVSCEEKVEDALALNEYGLDSPLNIITVTMSDGTVYELRIGEKNDISSNYYMMLNDDETIYTISSDLPEAFMIGIEDLLDDASE